MCTAEMLAACEEENVDNPLQRKIKIMDKNKPEKQPPKPTEGKILQQSLDDKNVLIRDLRLQLATLQQQVATMTGQMATMTGQMATMMGQMAAQSGRIATLEHGIRGAVTIFEQHGSISTAVADLKALVPEGP